LNYIFEQKITLTKGGLGSIGLPVKVSAGTVCVWVDRALPVKVSAGTVRFGAVALHAVVDPVPAAIFVAAQFPEVAVAELVPAGVPALVAPVVVVLFVPTGVMVALPPVVPTSPLALKVPRSILPFSAPTSDHPTGQVPERINATSPLGMPIVV